MSLPRLLIIKASESKAYFFFVAALLAVLRIFAWINQKYQFMHDVKFFMIFALVQIVLVIPILLDVLRRPYEISKHRAYWVLAIIFLGFFGVIGYFIFVKRHAWNANET